MPSVVAVAAALQESNTTLEILDISNNHAVSCHVRRAEPRRPGCPTRMSRCHTPIRWSAPHAFSRAPRPVSLHLLLLSLIPQDEPAIAFSKVLARHPSLWALSLSRWRMNDYGLENLITVSHAALENQTLRYLDLSWCGRLRRKSGPLRCCAKIEGLTSMPCTGGESPDGLSSLSLPTFTRRSNRLTEVSGKFIARLIAANTPLETLRLGCNELHDNAAYEIANSLMDNETLVELDLSFNGLTDGALQELAQGVSQARSISSIRLWGNLFGPAAASTWGALIQARGCLLAAAAAYAAGWHRNC